MSMRIWWHWPDHQPCFFCSRLFLLLAPVSSARAAACRALINPYAETNMRQEIIWPLWM
jgi:hypothetical protein